MFDPWIPLAARRARCWLVDGSQVVLVGAPRRKGHRARVEFEGGRQRTVRLEDITAVEDVLPLDGDL